jgi:hypothetical protein
MNRDDDILRAALKVIQQLLSTHPEVGVALVPYYVRTPPLN